MVHNITRIAQLPFSNAQLHAHSRIMRGKGLGAGMGSVLLRKGGAGAGSSYMDIDDYVHTTGINPYARGKASSGQGLGAGMKKMSEKLAKLSVETDKPLSSRKMKKIVMSL